VPGSLKAATAERQDGRAQERPDDLGPSRRSWSGNHDGRIGGRARPLGYRRPVSTILETERLRLRNYHRDLSDL
jgi:hypothetical protein